MNLNFNLLFLIPSIIGSFRHVSYFVFKYVPSLLYKSKKLKDNEEMKITTKDVSIICPCYKPDPEEFKQAIKTWINNNPFEIIFLPDNSSYEILTSILNEFKDEDVNIKILPGYNPDKRNAMYNGYLNSEKNYICYVDDDVVFSDNLLEQLLIPINKDDKIYGVGPKQLTLPKTDKYDVWDVMMDIKLYQRFIEVKSSTFIDGGSSCLSGRCVLYNKKLFEEKDKFKEYFTNERFFGNYISSADDKCLTRLLVNSEYKMFHQVNNKCYIQTRFEKGKTLSKQILRWYRNTTRSDLILLFRDRKIWFKYPFTAILMLDRFISPFSMISGLIIFIILFLQEPSIELLLLYLLYLVITRGLKLLRYITCKKEDESYKKLYWCFIYFFPFILFQYWCSLIKIYSIFTMHISKWGSRDIIFDKDNEEESSSLEHNLEKNVKEICIDINNSDNFIKLKSIELQSIYDRDIDNFISNI